VKACSKKNEALLEHLISKEKKKTGKTDINKQVLFFPYFWNFYCAFVSPSAGLEFQNEFEKKWLLRSPVEEAIDHQ
jgi:hypothetical protein